MAWIAVNKDGEEKIFECKPERGITTMSKIHLWTYNLGYDSVPLPKGTIKKLIGRDMVWEDEPIELK